MFFRKKKHSEYDDNTLMRLVCSGDQKAFSCLYDRYASRLQYYFYRMLGNDKGISEDFLQELFMKIVYKPDAYNPDQTFSTWIYTIAHNMCKNEYRRRAIRNEKEFEVRETYSDTSAPSKENEQEVLVSKIFMELEGFDELHKTVFLLKYREGLSVKEIADIVQVSEGTVKSRLFTTRQRLSDKFSSEYQAILTD